MALLVEYVRRKAPAATCKQFQSFDNCVLFNVHRSPESHPEILPMAASVAESGMKLSLFASSDHASGSYCLAPSAEDLLLFQSGGGARVPLL